MSEIVLTKGQEQGLKTVIDRYKHHEKFTAIAGFAGTGKAQPNDTKIMTPNGYTTIGELKVGDYVFDRNGKQTKVIGVYPQGKKRVFKVTLEDGRSTLCNDEHIFSYYSHGKLISKTVKEMLRIGVQGEYKQGFKFKIPMNRQVEFNKIEYGIDPYVIGSFLGNGCCVEKYLTLSSNDEEHVAEISKILNATYKKNSEHNYNWTFKIDGKCVKTIDFFKDFNNYICCKSHEKRIPDIYKYGGVEQRLSLIQGLMDTDGSIQYNEGRYNVSYSSVSKKLIEDIREVLYSLGYKSSIRTDTREGKYSHSNGVCYSLGINISNNEKYKLFRLKRKKDIALNAMGKYQNKNYSKISIIDIQDMDYEIDMTCIMVDNEEHLYLTNDYIVTHNTTLVRCIIESLHLKEEEVNYVCYTRKAALVLQSKGCPGAMTLHELLYHSKELPDGTWQHTPRKDLESPRVKIVVIDEASMMEQAMWELLMEHNVYVLALGDPFQLPAINQSANLLDKPHVFLDEIVRQAADNEIIQLSLAIREGKRIDYYKGKDVRIISRNQVGDKLLLGSDIILCGKNVTRYDLNKHMRQLIWGDAFKDSPIENDKIICLKNNNKLGIVNGELGKIKHIFTEDTRLFKPRLVADFETESGDYHPLLHMDYKIFTEGKKTITQDNWRLYQKSERPEEFDFGYAVTVHKAQGSQ